MTWRSDTDPHVETAHIADMGYVVRYRRPARVTVGRVLCDGCKRAFVARKDGTPWGHVCVPAPWREPHRADGQRRLFITRRAAEVYGLRRCGLIDDGRQHVLFPNVVG